MDIADFDFDLPPELIAQRPLGRREDSRMMVLDRKNQSITHARFQDFPRYLQEHDVLVYNDSRVIPARVWGYKDRSEVEFLFLRELEENTWEVLCRPAKKLRLGDKIRFSPTLTGSVSGIGSEGRRFLRFSGKVREELRNIGYAPLPPYIRREKGTSLREMDLERYQTVFASGEGSIAAPTAGLHFTPELLAHLREKGVIFAPLSLDVGLATFQPVRVNRVEDHTMLSENYDISRESAETVNKAKKEGRPVTAVGTTSVRSLESGWDIGLLEGRRETDIYIYPGFTFHVVDRLLTNFHLPRSTLLMLVSAFAGRAFVLQAYGEAVKERYRFFSYGDCMLIL
jgi:S-adenosylmethionine:tRNA ribosyltransferase-isomerase